MICFDIETGPAANAADFLDEPTPPSNYKDVEKIRAWIAESKARQLADATLSPITARVLAVGALVDDSAEPVIFHGGDEKRVLLDWWAFYRQHRQPRAPQDFLGFNCFTFDLPMLAQRSFVNGIRPPLELFNDRGFPAPFFRDLRNIWGCGNRQPTGSLDTLARLFGIGSKAGSGADFAKLYAADPAAALAYLKNDLRLTRELARRLLGPEAA